MFSSDYPHPEGGRAPLARLAAIQAGTEESAKAHFYAENFARLFASA